MKNTIISIAIVFLLAGFCGYATATEQGSLTIGAPTALRLMIVPDGFKLSWKASPDDPEVVMGYEIVRADLASGPFITVGTVAGGVSEYVDTSASKEIIYYYKIRAMAGSAYSPDSNTVTGER